MKPRDQQIPAEPPHPEDGVPGSLEAPDIDAERIGPGDLEIEFIFEIDDYLPE